MATLAIVLEGEGIIDNAVIYLEDPDETIAYPLDPEEDTRWSTEVTLPIDDELDYGLHVVAFSGTRFTCTITREDEQTIKLKGITGERRRNRADLIGAASFDDPNA